MIQSHHEVTVCRACALSISAYFTTPTCASIEIELPAGCPTVDACRAVYTHLAEHSIERPSAP